MSDSSITLQEYMLKSSPKKKKKRIYAKRNHEYQPYFGYFGLQNPLTKILELLGKTSLLKVKSLNFLSKQIFRNSIEIWFSY